MSMIATVPERRSRTERRRPTLPPIVSELKAALEEGEIEVLFQPQFSAASGELIGAEALSRWNHREGIVGGERLFALGAQGRFVEALSHHVAGRALASAQSWPAGLRLSINATATDVLAFGFADKIARAAAEAGCPPERLTIEITEQSLLKDLERTAASLRKLTGSGVRIALDDFGAGFCNFDYLKRLPLHYLKLDRAMIEGIDSDPRDRVVLRGIVAMARGLGLDVIAEGVERESQRAVIAQEGCMAWQGFLGAGAMTSAEFTALALPA